MGVALADGLGFCWCFVADVVLGWATVGAAAGGFFGFGVDVERLCAYAGEDSAYGYVAAAGADGRGAVAHARDGRKRRGTSAAHDAVFFGFSGVGYLGEGTADSDFSGWNVVGGFARA